MAEGLARRSPASRGLDGLLFCMPLLALVGTFVVWPLVDLVRFSFSRYDGLTPARWVGTANYRFLWNWEDFRRILVNNAILACGVALWVVVPFVLSILVFGMKRANLIRTVLFIPAMLSPIVVGAAFRIVLADDGPVNESLRTIGLGALAPGWLSSERFVLVTVILVICWATMGSGVLFYSSGLAALPPSYAEAAALDGAGFLRLVHHIYRPALRPITRFWTMLLTVSTITGFFPWIYGLTNGGPGVSSTTLDYAVYVTLNQGDQLGRGAAIALIAVVLVVIILAIQQFGRVLRRDPEWT
jgi:ABC-type sugar transport system permease subunit